MFDSYKTFKKICKKYKKVLDSVLQSVKILPKFGKYQKSVGLRALERGYEGRDGGGDGAGRSKSTKKIQKQAGGRPRRRAGRTVEKIKRKGSKNEG